MPSRYRFARPLVARMSGAVMAALGVLVLVIALLVALVSLPAVVLSVIVVVAVVGSVGAMLLFARGAVVVLSDAGYRVRFVRGAGVLQAGWKEVESMSAATIAGERYVVLKLHDGRTTMVPVRVLEGSPDDFVRDLQAHLNRGYGYRRIA